MRRSIRREIYTLEGMVEGDLTVCCCGIVGERGGGGRVVKDGVGGD